MAGADIEHRDKQGRAAMYRAAEGGHSTIVEQLVDNGAKLDKLTNDGIKDLSTFSTISGSRNHTISTISGSRNFFVHF